MNWRVQIQSYASDTLPADRVVNTLFFTGDAPSSAAWQTFFQALSDAWNAHPGLAYKHHTITSYNMADPEPRPEIAQKVTTGTDGATGPTEVALCLSYYSGRNLPRSRGRIYLGPFASTSVAANAPSTTLVTGTLTLGQAINTAAKAVPLVWSMHSVKENNYQAITNIWCDNAWDTQRRRGLKASTRSQGTIT